MGKSTKYAVGSVWLALALGGFSYTSRERVVDLGPLKVDADKEHSFPIAPIAGVGALVGGIALV